LLQSNNAVVDSSPVVIDAYGDFDGSGIRTWHTVLVASAGGNNREVFALDVTNPLKPVLLWDLQASFEDQAGLQFAPVPLSDDDPIQSNGIGNTPPAGVTLFSKTGNSLIDTAYVGDDEGALWELDAADGVNVNSFRPFKNQLGATLCGSGQQCNFALSQGFWFDSSLPRTVPATLPATPALGPQPISSLSTVFLLPTGLTGPLSPYAGQPMLAYGTAGTDTISGLEPASGTGTA